MLPSYNDFLGTVPPPIKRYLSFLSLVTHSVYLSALSVTVLGDLPCEEAEQVFWFCFFSAMSWYLVELYCYSVCRKPEDCSFCTSCLKGAVLCGISINSSLSGHCHEKNLDGSHDKEKYFEHHESVTAVAEGHSEGGTEDPEVLTQGSARDPSILRLESKSA